jgi:hypothetical protein
VLQVTRMRTVRPAGVTLLLIVVDVNKQTTMSLTVYVLVVVHATTRPLTLRRIGGTNI